VGLKTIETHHALARPHHKIGTTGSGKRLILLQTYRTPTCPNQGPQAKAPLPHYAARTTKTNQMQKMEVEL